MKGIIFNLLQDVIVRHAGEEAWDGLLRSTQLSGVYTSLGSYPDADLFALVAATSALLGQPPEAVLRFFGIEAMPLLARKYPVFFEGHRNTRSFLLTLNDIIHPEVRKIYPGADVPDFSYEGSSADVLVMEYASARKLCALAEGLIEGAAKHFGETVRIAHPRCMKRGAERCVLEVSFGGSA